MPDQTMEHTHLIDAADLEDYVNVESGEEVIPELVWRLVKEISDHTECRIPIRKDINQEGYDGVVETAAGFPPFVPAGRSIWEIGTGVQPQTKATKEYTKRTKKLTADELRRTAFLFVTPRMAGRTGWPLPSQQRWLARRASDGWRSVQIIDATKLAAWLFELPGVAKWLLGKMGKARGPSSLVTPYEHWSDLLKSTRAPDPPLPSKLFLVGRDQAYKELHRIFSGESSQLVLTAQDGADVDDFVAAYLASLPSDAPRPFEGRCIFIKDPDTWLSMSSRKVRHILIADPRIDLLDTGRRYFLAAKDKHSIVIPNLGSFVGDNPPAVLRSPSASAIEAVLIEGAFSADRARELSQAGALSLASLIRKLNGLPAVHSYGTGARARPLAETGLIGRWDGESPADKAAIERTLGKTYGEWIGLVRQETLEADTPLIQRDEKWKIITREETWTAVGRQLTNDDLERFQSAANLVLGERDPKFALPQEERLMAKIRGKVPSHSAAIREGMAESLALLGTRDEALKSCSLHKAEIVANLTVRGLLHNSDWITWASLGNLLPLLAEAAPDEFLEAVDSALSADSASPFHGIFAQETNGIVGWTHISGLLWSLETLAWDPKYFGRVVSLLGDLAAIDPGGTWTNRPINSLVNILLPWHSQTCASIELRRSVVGTLMQAHPIVGWNLLMALLPKRHGIAHGSRKPTWRKLISADWSERVSGQDYWAQVNSYADLAVCHAAPDFAKLGNLVDRLPDLPTEIHQRILAHFESDDVARMPEDQRRTLWEALVDLAMKHRKFAHAAWALPAEAVANIENAATKIAPSSPEGIHRRLFSERDYDLYDENGDWEEQRERLDARRQGAAHEILLRGGLPGIVSFSKDVGSPAKLGEAVGRLDTPEIDTALLPSHLGIEERTLAELLRGLIWGRYLSQQWKWVDGLDMSHWTNEQKVDLFIQLPFKREGWSRAERALGEQSFLYWQRIPGSTWGEGDDLIESGQKLLEHGRPRAAMDALWRLVYKKATFPSSFAVDVLTQSLSSTEADSHLDQHHVEQVIAWLQDNSSSDQEALKQIEWQYLPWLDPEFGGAPKALERAINENPIFFCEIIAVVYRANDQPKSETPPTEEENHRATNCYRLLRAWRTVPGHSAEAFDEAHFKAWLSAVKRTSKELGRFEVAMSEIGQTLPYAPPDPSGLWIHKAVAEALDARDGGDLRSGFTMERFNQRGTHGFTAGEEEREIAAAIHKQTDELEIAGFSRFAAEMRRLAKGYERDAERDAARNPFEN